MNTAVIINPIAGAHRHTGRARAELARHLLARHAVQAEVFVTERVGHAFELAEGLVQRAVSLVLAWGGDGTVNEVGAALAFHDVALGIIPAGSGNGLARELSIDQRPERALASALGGGDRRIDVGELNGRLFFSVAGIGFDAHIARLFNARARRGPLPYVTSTVRALFSYVPADYTLALGHGVIQRKALLVGLANSRQYGIGASIAPSACIDDGRLELVVVDARSALASLWQARRLFTGSLPRARGVLTMPVEQVTISSDRPIRFHVDGESGSGGFRVAARVHPGALRVRVPAAG